MRFTQTQQQRPVYIFKESIKNFHILSLKRFIFLVFIEEITFRHFLLYILQSSGSFYFSVISQTLKSEN